MSVDLSAHCMVYSQVILLPLPALKIAGNYWNTGRNKGNIAHKVRREDMVDHI